MAKIFPFRALRYNLSRIGDATAVMAPLMTSSPLPYKKNFTNADAAKIDFFYPKLLSGLVINSHE